MILRIAHIAIAVKSGDAALKLYQHDLGLRLDGSETVQSEGVKTTFLSPLDDNTNIIELLEPLSPESSVAKFIEKKSRGGIHHIAFLVDNIEQETQRLLSSGYRFVSDKPRCGAHNTLVVFLHPQSCDGVLIELVQEQK